MKASVTRREVISSVNLMLALLLTALLFSTGCATNISRPTQVPMKPTVPFGVFENVEMKAVEIAPAFASQSANKKALKKIDENLFKNIMSVFPNLKRIESDGNFSSTGKRTLQITPYIKEIKFIGGGARFWVGAMAGSSAVLMQTTFCDSSHGEIIADPEFFQRAMGAFGIEDNLMLNRIGDDLVKYCSDYK